MQDCDACTHREYCIPDECAYLTKKRPALPETRRVKPPTTVYHIKQKEKSNMTEMRLEVKAGSAEELKRAIEELYLSFGNKPAIAVGHKEPAPIEEKKSSKKAVKKEVTEVPLEAPTEAAEEVRKQKTIAELIEEAKTFVKDGGQAAKDKIKAFLVEKNVEKLSLLPEDVAPELQALLEG